MDGFTGFKTAAVEELPDVVTVMDPDGTPTPVAWTRMRAPESLMAPMPEDQLKAGIAGSPLMAKYGQAIDRDSAREMLARKLEQGARAAEEEAVVPRVIASVTSPAMRSRAPVRAPWTPPSSARAEIGTSRPA